jgi:putative Holliday junction resolvase
MASNNLVMAFDFGMRKIGIAVGQPITATATPITIISASNGIPDWRVIEQLIDEWQPVLLVIGLPLNMDNSESNMSRLARKFARKLNGRFNIAFEMMDERLTSFEARPAGRNTSIPIDHLSAQLILESYFRQ